MYFVAVVGGIAIASPVVLGEAKDLLCWKRRSFAALRMTGGAVLKMTGGDKFFGKNYRKDLQFLVNIVKYVY